MGEYLLGIDIGTSACKIAVFAKDGTVRATGTGDYQVYYPHPGWAEQNPEEWWEAVCDAIPKVLAKGNISPEEIKGIGIDGQSWSAIAVDKDGNVLTNTPIWMDTRATDICEEFNEKIGKDKIFELAGNRFDLHQWKYCFEFRNCHIGDSDESCQSVFDEFFTLSVCIHEFFHTEWFRIRIS